MSTDDLARLVVRRAKLENRVPEMVVCGNSAVKVSVALGKSACEAIDSIVQLRK